MQSYHSSPDRSVYSPEEFGFQFPFSLYTSDQLDTMQTEETNDKNTSLVVTSDESAGLGGGNGNVARDAQDHQSPAQHLHRHSSGDTAPSSNESVANIFSPWGAFSPADSVHTSTRTTMSFGPSSLNSTGANWSRSPPVGLSNAEEEADALTGAPMLCTGGAMGPLDTQPSSQRTKSRDYKDLDNLFDTMALTERTSPCESQRQGIAAEDDLFCSANRQAVARMQGESSELPRPTKTEYEGYFESLYARGPDRAASTAMHKHGDSDPFSRISGLEGSAVWGAPLRTGDDRSTTPQRQGLETGRHRNVHSIPDLYSWTPPHRQQDAQMDDFRVQTPFTAGHTAFNSAFSNLPGSPYGQGMDTSAPLTPEYSIFVGDLCPDLREEDLVSQFLRPPHWPASHPFAIAHAHAQHAQGNYSTPAKTAPAPFLSTKSATIMTDPLTGASRGFGFVRFSSEQDCTRALIEMQGVIISPRTGQAGRPLRVCPATPKNRSSSTSSLSATGALTAIGERVFGASTLPQQLGSSSPLAALNSSSSAIGASSSSAQVSAVPPLQAGDNSARQYSASALDPNNTTVFVGGLSSLISEETLKTFFVPFGEIKYVKIPPGKGCGFVQFVRKMDAERAIERMQGFPIGGGRIRLSWGRSQGDKAAAAAAHAAAQAAQIGHLAGLAGLNPLTTSQLTAVTLASSTGASSNQEASSLLVRRLTAAAAAASAGHEDRKALESLHGASADLLSDVQASADSAAFALYRPQVPTTTTVPAATPVSATSLSSAFAARPNTTSTWPDLDVAPKRSQTLADQQLASLFGSLRFSGGGAGAGFDTESSQLSHVGSQQTLRERSQTYSLGTSSAQPQSHLGAFASPFSSGSLAFATMAEPRSELGPMPRTMHAAMSPTPKRSMHTLSTEQSSLFRPFSPLPPRVGSVKPEMSMQQQKEREVCGGIQDNSTHVSSGLSFKRYLEHLREREREQQKAQQQQQQEEQCAANAQGETGPAPPDGQTEPVQAEAALCEGEAEAV